MKRTVVGLLCLVVAGACAANVDKRDPPVPPPAPEETLPEVSPFDCRAVCNKIRGDCGLGPKPDETNTEGAILLMCIMSCDVFAQYEGGERPDDPLVRYQETLARCVGKATTCAQVEVCLDAEKP